MSMKNYFVFKNKPALVTLWIMEPAYAGMKADSRRKKKTKRRKTKLTPPQEWL